MSGTITPDGRRVLSVSSVNLHRRCPQAWAYRYVHRLEHAEQEQAFARELGSMWHAVRAMDSIYRGIHQSGTLRSWPSEITTGDFGPAFALAESDSDIAYENRAVTAGKIRNGEDMLLALTDWWLSLPLESREPWIEYLDGTTLPQHLAEMNARWHERWDDELDNEHVLGVEVSATRESGAMGYTGKIDEIYWDAKRQMVVVRDRKANRTIAGAESEDDVTDVQLHLYSWLVEPLLESWGYVGPSAVSYDRARSAVPKQPQVTKSGKLSKSVTDYPLDVYEAFTEKPVPYEGLKKDGSGAGFYERDEAVVRSLSTPAEQDKWNRRTLTPVNFNIVQSHLRAARLTGYRMTSTEAAVRDVGEAERSLSRQSCKFCDFRELCLSEMRSGVALDPAEFGLRSRD